jgi:lipoteichoic acid synthase
LKHLERLLVAGTQRHRVARLCLSYGAGLFLVLAALRFEKVVAARVRPEPGDWLVILSADLGSILLLEAAWFVAAALAGSRARWVKRVFVCAHVAIAAFALVDHQFFLKTGSSLDLKLVAYAIANFGQLGAMIGTGLEYGFVLRCGLAVLCLLGAEMLGGKRRADSAFPAVLVWAGGAVGACLLLFRPGPASAESMSLAQGLFDRFTDNGRGQAEVAITPIAPEEYYQPPVLVSEPQRRPNIVLMLLESTRLDVVAPRPGSPAPSSSPFVLSLSESGLFVEDAYTTVSHTSKTLVGLLCGMYGAPTMLPIETARALPLHCLPGLLNAAGYHTAFFQTASGAFENRPGLVRNFGFQTWKVGQDLMGPEFERVGYFGMDEYAMLQPALDWVDQTQGAPFFLTLLTVTTHHPYHVPGERRPETEEEVWPAYRAAVARIDGFVRDFHAGLAQRGLIEDTVFIVLGDHGEAFGEHGLFQHNYVPYEEVVRVPWIMSGRRWLGEPRRITGLRSELDLMPTILELLGVEWVGRLPGKSLLQPRGHDEVVTFCWNPSRCMGMRWGNLHFIDHFGERPLEVFDVSRDPEELVDLADEIPQGLVRAARTKMISVKQTVEDYYRGTLGEAAVR